MWSQIFFKKPKMLAPKSTSHLLCGPGQVKGHLWSVKKELPSPGNSVLSAPSFGCPLHLGHTYHLSGLLELGVEAPELLGHLSRCPEGPASLGEDASAVGAAGCAVVSGAELTRARSWDARCLPGAPTELCREGPSEVPKAPQQPLPSHTKSQTSPWQLGTRNLFPWQQLSTP